MEDINGRPYVRLSSLKVGDTIEVDGDFTCIAPHSRREVRVARDGRLIFKCRSGNHYLDGQLAPDGVHLIGIYKV